MFDVNIYMKFESTEDFSFVRKKIQQWRKRFPMFRHDVNQIENSIEDHIQQYSIFMVNYRQSHKKIYLEKAKKEIESINNIIAIAEKIELISILSQ